MRLNTKLLAIVAAVAILLVLGVQFGLPRLRPYAFHGTVMQATEKTSDITLTAHTGERVSLKDFEGKYVAIYFGYTFCPDVCPTTLAALSLAMNLLGDKTERVQVLMITVDPERDTPERLAQYVPAFNPSFLGLTGSPEEIAAAAAPFGIFYAKNEVAGASEYLMDHTASVILLDDQGRIRLIWPYGTTAESIAEDLDHLLR